MILCLRYSYIESVRMGMNIICETRDQTNGVPDKNQNFLFPERSQMKNLCFTFLFTVRGRLFAWP